MLELATGSYAFIQPLAPAFGCTCPWLTPPLPKLQRMVSTISASSQAERKARREAHAARRELEAHAARAAQVAHAPLPHASYPCDMRWR